MSQSRYEKIIQNAAVVEWGDHPLAEIDGDRYFTDGDVLVQHYIYNIEPDDEIVLPRYMHVVNEVPLGDIFNAENFVEGIRESMFNGCEDFDDSYDWLDFEGLERLIQDWMEKQPYRMYDIQFDKVVDLKEFWERELTEEGLEGRIE